MVVINKLEDKDFCFAHNITENDILYIVDKNKIIIGVIIFDNAWTAKYTCNSVAYCGILKYVIDKVESDGHKVHFKPVIDFD